MASAVVSEVPNRGILLASPSTSFREQVLRNFDAGSVPVTEVNGGADALVQLESGRWQLLLLDRQLPDLNVEELIEIVKRRFPGIEVVLLDSTGETSGRISLTPSSWVKSLAKPGQEASSSAEPFQPAEALPGMIGSSEDMQRVYRWARLVAPRNTTVLILGATGTGKELVARAIHRLSPRAHGPWVVVNCAAIPETLLESELYGYAKGAFTGAVQSYAGRIQAAQGGTLFLDEVGELPLSLQAKLLRFLEQKEIQRLGSSDAVRVDVRVVAATNTNLDEQVEDGKFRRDLYYRLSTFPLELPTLAERREDIQPLAEHFLRSLAGNRAVPVLSQGAVCILHEQSWRGNVRELAQVMERAVILAEGKREILPEHLLFPSDMHQARNRKKLPERMFLKTNLS